MVFDMYNTHLFQVTNLTSSCQLKITIFSYRNTYNTFSPNFSVFFLKNSLLFISVSQYNFSDLEMSWILHILEIRCWLQSNVLNITTDNISLLNQLTVETLTIFFREVGGIGTCPYHEENGAPLKIFLRTAGSRASFNHLIVPCRTKKRHRAFSFHSPWENNLLLSHCFNIFFLFIQQKIFVLSAPKGGLYSQVNATVQNEPHLW